MQTSSEDTHHGKSTPKYRLSLLSNIPSRIIKDNADISQILFISALIIQFISSLFHQPFSWQISLLFLRSVTETLSYRTVSILLNILNICEWSMFCFISNFMDSCLTKQQCWIRKWNSTQYCPFVPLQKWKKCSI